ncbi:rod shape-determining protein MreD [Chlamydia suis]|uniref:rod shape-determining protein MreD n=1 Tax=Chlamydia suis TaxID=83559 RepID=UPI0013A535D6|nr:rod shape-determining protein MreD [Chlamydia suis]
MLSFLLFPRYFPEWRPVYFAPLVVTTFYSHPKERVLLWAMLSGLLCDMGSTCFMGIQAFLYVSTSLILYKTQKFFIKERWISLPLISALFALTFYFLSYPVLAFFNRPLCLYGMTFLADLQHVILVDLPYGTFLSLLIQKKSFTPQI